MAVRQAAATARRHLLTRAAKVLGASIDHLEVSDGLVRARGANESTSYWELMQGEPFDIPVDVDLPVKDPGAHGYVGRAMAPRGLAELVTGRVRYVHDLQPDGMLHARVIRPPHYHARLQSLDESVLASIAPAQSIRDGSFLAVAAEDEYLATRAAARVASAATWSPGQGLDVKDIFERLRENRRTSLPVVNGTPIPEPVPAPFASNQEAHITLEARYERPYQMHASIAPSAAMALYDDDRLVVWSHTQGIYPLRASLAETLGMIEDAVELIHTPGAGCYGHNGADDAALDAALIARAIPGRPVLLKWTREDEHAWEPYAPAMAVEMRASVNRNGRILDWSHESYSDTHLGRPRPGPNRAGPARLLAAQHLREPVAALAAQPNMGRHAGIHRNAEPLYEFAQQRIVKHLVQDLPLRTSAMRTLGAFANVFAIESFVDELACACGADPVELRLNHLHDERAREVIRCAADHFGWRSSPRLDGVGHGIAFARYKNSVTYAAVAMELEVDAEAVVHLRRAVIAADAGQVIDPDGLRAQLEGGVLQAASWAIHEEVGYDTAGVTTTDWESYPILRFDNVPSIETVLIDRPDRPPLGAGEASCGPTGAAIANAIFDATGLRLRRMPFRPDAVRAAALHE